jgi:hypothetical protein
VPGATKPEVVTLKVEDPELLTELGLNEALAPLGTPLMVRLMVPGAPWTMPMLTV